MLLNRVRGLRRAGIKTAICGEWYQWINWMADQTDVVLYKHVAERTCRVTQVAMCLEASSGSDAQKQIRSETRWLGFLRLVACVRRPIRITGLYMVCSWDHISQRIQTRGSLVLHGRTSLSEAIAEKMTVIQRLLDGSVLLSDWSPGSIHFQPMYAKYDWYIGARFSQGVRDVPRVRQLVRGWG